jgi:phage terminase Nu1 subunit (DNA packaging protein)
MATQEQIAADLGISQPAVSEAMAAMKLDCSAMTLAEARRVMVKHYSETAAGRGGAEQYNLTKERSRESRLKGDMLELQIHEKAGSLIQATAVEREWQSLIVAARSELMMLPGKIATELKAVHGIDIDAGLIEIHILEALWRLADTEPDE